MLSRYLESEGFRVSTAESGTAMRKALASEKIDLVLLDLVLAGEDGLELAREIRASSRVGIIMVTGRSDIIDMVVGLEVGADDYIAKPFQLREVLARTRSVLRRLQPSASTETAKAVGPSSRAEVIGFEGWRLDISRRELMSPEGQEVPLTTGEFDLLAAMAKHPGRVLSRDMLMDLTRGREWDALDRSIDAQVVRLRRKLEADPKNPKLIKSVRGAGYVFAGRIERM